MIDPSDEVDSMHPKFFAFALPRTTPPYLLPSSIGTAFRDGEDIIIQLTAYPTSGSFWLWPSPPSQQPKGLFA